MLILPPPPPQCPRSRSCAPSTVICPPFRELVRRLPYSADARVAVSRAPLPEEQEVFQARSRPRRRRRRDSRRRGQCPPAPPSHSVAPSLGCFRSILVASRGISKPKIPFHHTFAGPESPQLAGLWFSRAPTVVQLSLLPLLTASKVYFRSQKSRFCDIIAKNKKRKTKHRSTAKTRRTDEQRALIVNYVRNQRSANG